MDKPNSGVLWVTFTNDALGVKREMKDDYSLAPINQQFQIDIPRILNNFFKWI